MGRYAAIDIGSNSTLLLLVERKHRGGVRVLADLKISTRLSSGADAHNSITQAAIERQFAALEQIAELLKNYHADKVVACGTQIFRVARNGAELAARIGSQFDWTVEVVDGAEEARLSYKAAAVGLGSVPPDHVVVDVGGGSSEVVFGSGDEVRFAQSFPIGAVKLAEEQELTDRASAAALQRANLQISAIIPSAMIAAVPRGQFLIAVGGTASTLAALQLGRQVFDPTLIHGLGLTRKWLEETIAQLAGMSADERRAKLPFDPERAEIIVAGALILTYLVDVLGVDELRVSNRGLRWGLLIDRFPELQGAPIEQSGNR